MLSQSNASPTMELAAWDAADKNPVATTTAAAPRPIPDGMMTPFIESEKTNTGSAALKVGVESGIGSSRVNVEISAYEAKTSNAEKTVDSRAEEDHQLINNCALKTIKLASDNIVEQDRDEFPKQETELESKQCISLSKNSLVNPSSSTPPVANPSLVNPSSSTLPVANPSLVNHSSIKLPVANPSVVNHSSSTLPVANPSLETVNHPSIPLPLANSTRASRDSNEITPKPHGGESPESHPSGSPMHDSASPLPPDISNPARDNSSPPRAYMYEPRCSRRLSAGSEYIAADQRASEERCCVALKNSRDGAGIKDHAAANLCRCCRKRGELKTGAVANGGGRCKGTPLAVRDGQGGAGGRDAVVRDVAALPCDAASRDAHEDKGHQSSYRYMNSRAKADEAYVPTDMEHLANVLTHGLWIVPSVVGLWWMMRLATTLTQQLIAAIYGLSLFCLFTISTTYHTLAYTERFRTLKNFFHIGDRAAIYFFIASSYTPWLMLKEFNQWGTLILFVVWTGAVLGIAYQYTFHEQYKLFETLLYLMVGVAPALIIVEMEESSGLCELAVGGAIYIAGVVFFKCDGVIPFAHAIWHVFVFVGAVFHYVAVCRHLLGNSGAPLESSADAGASHKMQNRRAESLPVVQFMLKTNGKSMQKM